MPAGSIDCWYAWNAICTTAHGSVKPCCVYEHDVNRQFDGNWHQAVNTPEMQSIRKQLQQGKWPKGCMDCANDEYATRRSMRTKGLANISKNSYNSIVVDEPVYADIKYGNACNLSCYTCGGHSSSKILAEWNTHNEEDWLDETNIENRSANSFNFRWSKDVELRDNENLQTLKFTGGEPFQNKTVRRHLEGLIRAGRTDIDLQFVSNLFAVNPSWWHILDEFRSVQILASCDGTEELYEYIRYPARWPAFQEQFWELYNNSAYNVSITCTVSSLNVLNLVDMFEEFPGVRIDFDNMVYRPRFYDPRYLPGEVVELAVNRIKASGRPELNTVKNKLLSSKFEPQVFQELYDDTCIKDDIRGMVLRYAAPELMEFYDGRGF